jgi:hypothetical protein
MKVKIFFEERTSKLVRVKSEGMIAETPRNTLSKITSGRAITEPAVTAQIKEHVSLQATPKQKENLIDPKKCSGKKTKYKEDENFQWTQEKSFSGTWTISHSEQ